MVKVDREETETKKHKMVQSNSQKKFATTVPQPSYVDDIGHLLEFN